MPSAIAGILLAGGQSRRMGGGDKALMKLGGETLLDRIIARVRPQVGGPLVLNANGDPSRFAPYGLPIAPDVIEGYAGPLAGVLTGLEWARTHAPACEYVASFACDAPFVPRDLVHRLSLAVFEGAEMACATSGGREHPVFALWPVRLAGDLRRAVVEEGVRKVDSWTAHYRLARVAFSTDPVDPFFNVNAPEDMAAAEALL